MANQKRQQRSYQTNSLTSLEHLNSMLKDRFPTDLTIDLQEIDRRQRQARGLIHKLFSSAANKIDVDLLASQLVYDSIMLSSNKPLGFFKIKQRVIDELRTHKREQRVNEQLSLVTKHKVESVDQSSTHDLIRLLFVVANVDQSDQQLLIDRFVDNNTIADLSRVYNMNKDDLRIKLVSLKQRIMSCIHDAQNLGRTSYE